MTPEPPDAAIAGISALAEPLRRDLYDFVVRSRAAVSRDQAAQGLGIPGHTAKFHLDRLVDEGLLEAEFQRLTGRTGPGSGRPAKVYRPTALELEVSIPERRYDLLSHILATAVAEAVESAEDVGAVVARVARSEGERWGAAVAPREDLAELERLVAALAAGGYHPWVEEQTMLLDNCPFHRVAQEQTELVCGLNLEFVTGVAAGTGCSGLDVRLDPGPERCCVAAAPKDD